MGRESVVIQAFWNSNLGLLVTRGFSILKAAAEELTVLTLLVSEAIFFLLSWANVGEAFTKVTGLSAEFVTPSIVLFRSKGFSPLLSKLSCEARTLG